MLAVPAATPPQWDLIGYACIEIYGQDKPWDHHTDEWTDLGTNRLCLFKSERFSWLKTWNGSQSFVTRKCIFAVQKHHWPRQFWTHFLLGSIAQIIWNGARGSPSPHTGDQMIKMELWPETQKPQVSGRTFVEPRSQSPMFWFLFSRWFVSSDEFVS